MKHTKRSPLFICALCIVLFAQTGFSITVSETVDETHNAFKIETETITYYYDKAGAGFSSMVDMDGNDWLNYHPTPGGHPCNGEEGAFRGIPNMGFIGFGHPGEKGATSTITIENSDHVQIKSVKGAWKTLWDIYETYAVLTVESGSGNYWFLYEGTPGGADKANDIGYVSSNYKSNNNATDNNWQSKPLSSPAFRAFYKKSLQRSILLVHHQDDDVADNYYWMNDCKTSDAGMTVHGFGRNSSTQMLLSSATPQKFSVMILDTQDPEELTQMAQDLKNGEVTKNKTTPEALQGSLQPHMQFQDHAPKTMHLLNGQKVQKRINASTNNLRISHGVYVSVKNNNSPVQHVQLP